MNPWKIHATELLGGLAVEMGDDCPKFGWNGGNWNVIPGTAAYNQPLRLGGFTQVYDLSFNVLFSQFCPGIATAEILMAQLLNSEFTYRGVDYKIVAVDVMAGGAQIKVSANALNQNA